MSWGIKDILIGIVAVLILLFVVSVVLVSPFALAFGSDSQEARAASGISNAVWNAGMVLIVYLLVRRAGSDWSAVTTRPFSASPDAARRTKRLLGFELPWTVWCVLGGLAACYGVLYTFSAIVQIFGFDWLVPGEQIPDEYFDNTWLVIAIGIAVVITAPIAEEVFFRGFMFGGLRRTLPLWPAALISGVIFAIPHLDVGLMIPFTFIGAILANTYHASGRLAASITVHFIFNLVSFVLLVFVPEIRE